MSTTFRASKDVTSSLLCQAMPATVSWTADCGLGGLNVSLGSVELELSDALLEERVCKELVPLTGVKVRQILSGK